MPCNTYRVRTLVTETEETENIPEKTFQIRGVANGEVSGVNPPHWLKDVNKEKQKQLLATIVYLTLIPFVTLFPFCYLIYLP